MRARQNLGGADRLTRNSIVVRYMDPVCRISNIKRSAKLEFDSIVY